MIPSEEKGGTTPTTTAEAIDRLRLKYGFWIIITGFALVAFITIVATFRWSEVTSVATVVGAVASLVGTVVGAFFGVQVGAAGKDRAEASRERSDELARAALSMLPPETAQQLRSEMGR
jgi:membrane associated rhomboid family serine protease